MVLLVSNGVRCTWSVILLYATAIELASRGIVVDSAAMVYELSEQINLIRARKCICSGTGITECIDKSINAGPVVAPYSSHPPS